MNVETGKVYQGDEVTKALERGEPLEMLPHPPVPDCSLCHGKGSIPSFGTIEKHRKCPKCYPRY